MHDPEKPSFKAVLTALVRDERPASWVSERRPPMNSDPTENEEPDSATTLPTISLNLAQIVPLLKHKRTGYLVVILLLDRIASGYANDLIFHDIFGALEAITVVLLLADLVLGRGNAPPPPGPSPP
jgi:hypothetical protein